MNIKQKMMLLATVPMVLVALLVSLLAYYGMDHLGSAQLEQTRQQMMKSKQNELKQYIDIALTAIKPLYDGSSSDTNKEQAKKILRDLRYGGSGYFFVYRYDGTNVVLGPQPELEGKNLIDLKDAEGNPVIRNVIDSARSKDGFTQYLWENPSSDLNETKLSFSVDLDKWGWVIGTGFYITDIDQQIALMEKKVSEQQTYLLTIIFGGTVVALLITMFSSLWITHSITRPLQESVALMEDISEGDGDLTKRLAVNGNTEVDRLSMAFNKFVEKIHKIIIQVRGTTQSIQDATQNIHKLTKHHSGQLHLQRSETDQVATAMHQMSATASEVAQSATQAAEAANKAHEESDEGSQIVQSTISSIDELADSLEKAKEVMNKLDAETENIGSVLGVIGSIAEQTNLLALNAAIEAARAGEQGRGFSVVADEVRSLASRTQASTQEIQEMISRLQSESSTAVKVMNVSRDQSQMTVDQSKKAGEALSAINDSVNIINDMNHQIASAAEEQTKVSESINQNVTEISNIISDVAHGVEETAEATGKLSEQGKRLGELVFHFKV